MGSLPSKVGQKISHQPVLLKEALEYLNVKKGEKYLDATVGGGGHAEAIFKKGGQILGIDFDPEAIKAAREHLSQACPSRQSSKKLVETTASWRLAQGNFAHLKEIAGKEGFLPVSGVLFDLGVSSYQLENSRRGFSFRSSALLDMRMDPTLEVTAADLVNALGKKELARVFASLAEEEHSRRIADAIVRARKNKPIRTCRDLADLISGVVSQGRSRLHPATKAFQALRMVVNDELNNLRQALPQAAEILKSRDRLVIISFHSGEDRIAKQFLRSEKDKRLKILTKKPLRPSAQEIESNPRSRSAKLRAAEKR